MRRTLLTAALIAAAVPVVAYAHHGWSSYDETKPITLSGTFTELNWGNPHGSARMTWQNKTWDVVLAPVSRMEARGLTQAEVAPGKPVTLTGYARKDGTAEMRIERVKLGDKTVELR